MPDLPRWIAIAGAPRAARVRTSIARAVVLAAVLIAEPAATENLLANPSFPQVLGISSWIVDKGSAAWNTFECGFSSPSSGSLYLESSSGGGSGTIDQCVEATEGTRYQLIGSVYLASGTAARLRMEFLHGAGRSWSKPINQRTRP